MNLNRYYRFIKQLILLIVVSSILLFLSCSINPLAGGTTTETTNGIIAVILTEENEPAKNIPVQIRPQDYLFDPEKPHDPKTCKNTTTDDFGRFTFYFQNPEAAAYTIRAISQDSSEGVVVKEIALPIALLSRDDEDTVMLDLDGLTMEETGSFSGMYRSGSNSTDKMIIQFYGMDIFRVLDPDVQFEITGLPPQMYVIHISYTQSSQVYIDTIYVYPNTITLAKELPFVDPYAFYGMKKIVFNTTSEGANIIDDISPSFPLLIRLNSNNEEDSLIFAYTKLPGSIRLLDENNDTLDYQIERWDTTSSPKTAEIWVSIPVIFGNNNAQYIKLGYGATLPDIQDPQKVFNRDYGYASVWHLNEDSGTIVYDATAHQYNGIKVSDYDPLPFEGYIANGQSFDGVNDWIDIGQDINYINNTQRVTLFAWVYLKSYDCNIIQISGNDEQYSRLFISVDTNGRITAGGNALDTPINPEKKVTTTGTLELNKWYHLCCVISYFENKIDIYIDGVKATTTGTVQFEDHQTSSTNSKYAALGSYFTGVNGFSNCIIDECRIYRGERNPSWIKLCYETQRKDSPFFK